MKDQEDICPDTLYLVSLGASDLATRTSQSQQVFFNDIKNTEKFENSDS